VARDAGPIHTRGPDVYRIGIIRLQEAPQGASLLDEALTQDYGGIAA